MPPQVAGPLDVAVFGVEFDAAELLEVRRLRADQQGVDVGDLHVADQTQEHPHADAGEELHRLLGRDRLGRPQDAVGPAHLIVHVLLCLSDQKLAGPPLVVDQHGHDVAHLLDQFLLGLAERGLVGDLIEVAHRL